MLLIEIVGFDRFHLIPNNELRINLKTIDFGKPLVSLHVRINYWKLKIYVLKMHVHWANDVHVPIYHLEFLIVHLLWKAENDEKNEKKKFKLKKKERKKIYVIILQQVFSNLHLHLDMCMWDHLLHSIQLLRPWCFSKALNRLHSFLVDFLEILQTLKCLPVSSQVHIFSWNRQSLHFSNLQIYEFQIPPKIFSPPEKF